MDEVGDPTPSSAQPGHLSKVTLRVAVIGAAAALIGSLVGGGTSLLVAGSAYDSQQKQQAAQFTQASLNESRTQRLAAYKAWLQNAEPVIPAVAMSSECLWKNNSDQTPCYSQIRNGFEKMNALTPASLDVEIFGSDESVQLVHKYAALSQQFIYRAGDPNGPGIAQLRNDMTSIRDNFILLSCREISAQPPGRVQQHARLTLHTTAAVCHDGALVGCT